MDGKACNRKWMERHATGNGRKGRHLSQNQPILPSLEGPHVDHAAYLLHMCRGLGLAHAYFGWWFSLYSPPKAKVNLLYRSSCVSLTPSTPLIFLKTPPAQPMFDCGFLHRFPQVTEWSVSEDSYARILSVITASIINRVRSWLSSMGWVCSWASHSFAISSISAPPLSLYFLNVWQILNQRFYRWVGVSLPPLDVSPYYRRWQFQATWL